MEEYRLWSIQGNSELHCEMKACFIFLYPSLNSCNCHQPTIVNWGHGHIIGNTHPTIGNIQFQRLLIAQILWIL